MYDENSNSGNAESASFKGQKLTLKDKRRPTPLDVRLASQRARGELPKNGNGALSTPDIVNVTVSNYDHKLGCLNWTYL